MSLQEGPFNKKNNQAGSLCLFKKGIKPMWEDDRNKDGGRWIMAHHMKKRVAEYFTQIALAIMGKTQIALAVTEHIFSQIALANLLVFVLTICLH